MRRKLGRDVTDLVNDVRRVEETGRNRDTTWADPKKKGDASRVANVMGYIPRTLKRSESGSSSPVASSSRMRLD